MTESYVTYAKMVEKKFTVEADDIVFISTYEINVDVGEKKKKKINDLYDRFTNNVSNILTK